MTFARKKENRIDIEGDVAVIHLTQGQSVKIDAACIQIVKDYVWYAAKSGNVFYAYSGRHRKTTRMHRLISNAPDGVCVDHINGDGLDNRLCNLRFASIVENVSNQRKRATNTSGLKGVSLHKQSGKWRAQIVSCGITHSLGLHHTKEDAHNAYVKAAARLHGDFARAE